MFLVVISKQDQASVNIRERLLGSFDWTCISDKKFDNNQIYNYMDKAILVTINEYHLYFNDLDQKVTKDLTDQGLEVELECIIFASKHRSESGRKTLTVHPVGNFGKNADYGGKPEELSVSAPHMMTIAYRNILKNAKLIYTKTCPYSIAFEVTHHGPYLDKPSFFIEIGSDETAWTDVSAGKVIANSIMDLFDLESLIAGNKFPVTIGIGGGHYAPRHSDLARKKKISFGHMIPNYALENISENMLLRAIERTPEATNIYFHRKALKKVKYRTLKKWFEDMGYTVIRSNDLDDLDD